MKEDRVVFIIFILIILIFGYSYISVEREKDETKYYIVEGEKYTYFEDFDSMGNMFDLNSVLNKTIKSLNEVKNGKRDLDFIREIKSEELENDVLNRINDSRGKIKNFNIDVKKYYINGLVYDKDEKIIKVFIRTEKEGDYKEGEPRFLTMYDYQTYIYKIKEDRLFLLKYSLYQYIE